MRRALSLNPGNQEIQALTQDLARKLDVDRGSGSSGGQPQPQHNDNPAVLLQRLPTLGTPEEKHNLLTTLLQRLRHDEHFYFAGGTAPRAYGQGLLVELKTILWGEKDEQLQVLVLQLWEAMLSMATAAATAAALAASQRSSSTTTPHTSTGTKDFPSMAMDDIERLVESSSFLYREQTCPLVMRILTLEVRASLCGDDMRVMREGSSPALQEKLLAILGSSMIAEKPCTRKAAWMSWISLLPHRQLAKKLLERWLLDGLFALASGSASIGSTVRGSTGERSDDSTGKHSDDFIDQDSDNSMDFSMVPLLLAKVSESLYDDGSNEKGQEGDAQFFQQWCEIVFGKLFEGGDGVKSRSFALRFLSAVFQVSAESGAKILLKEGLLAEMVDCLEYEPVAIQMATLDVWSQACANKTTRPLIATQCMDYLMGVLRGGGNRSKPSGATNNHQEDHQQVKSLVAVVLTKLGVDRQQLSSSDRKDLCATFCAVIKGEAKLEPVATQVKAVPATTHHTSAVKKDPKPVSSTASDILKNALEGLAYLSMDGEVKETIVKDKAFLRALLDIAKRTMTTATPFLYGILLTLVNVSSYRRVRSEEEEQVRKLREFAKDVAQEKESPYDDPEYVEKRLDTLVESGVIPVLCSLAKSDSLNIRQAVATILLNCASRPKTRGLMVQQGSAKACLALTASVDVKERDLDDGKSAESTCFLAASHALARMAISLDPSVAFPNNAAMLVRPLMLLARGTSTLGQFESLLALTNLASMGDGTVLMRMEQAGALKVLEELQFSDNERVQCAATETICNLVTYTPIMELYAASKRGSTRLRLNLALSDAELESTRRAASGILAMVTACSPDFCRELAGEERAMDIVAGLIDPKVGVGGCAGGWGGRGRLRLLIHQTNACLRGRNPWTFTCAVWRSSRTGVVYHWWASKCSATIE